MSQRTTGTIENNAQRGVNLPVLPVPGWEPIGVLRMSLISCHGHFTLTVFLVGRKVFLLCGMLAVLGHANDETSGV